MSVHFKDTCRGTAMSQFSLILLICLDHNNGFDIQTFQSLRKGVVIHVRRPETYVGHSLMFKLVIHQTGIIKYDSLSKKER